MISTTYGQLTATYGPSINSEIPLDTLLPGIAKEAGIQIPLTISDEVAQVVEKSHTSETVPTSWDGVMWDILTMFKYGYRSAVAKGEEKWSFQVHINGVGRTKKIWFNAQFDKYEGFKVTLHPVSKGKMPFLK